jgi:uncharacterized protein (DUF1330 family)
MSERPGIAPSGEPTDFEGCLARVNPSKASLAQLAKQPDNTPVIMLNLLRFRPRGDASIYSLYGKEAAPEVEKVGSFVGYYGAVLTDLDPALGFDASYDAVVMPVYHRRSSYLALQRSSIYQLVIPYRSAGTSRRTLYVLSDGEAIFRDTHNIAEMDASRKSLPTNAGDIYVIDMVRYADERGREHFRTWAHTVGPLLRDAGATPLLSLQPEVPVLSEAYWDHCILTHFPSLDAVRAVYTSGEWKAAQDIRGEALENSITVATTGMALPTQKSVDQ